MRHLKVEFGSIYNSDGTLIIEEPAIMFNKDAGTLHKYGSYDMVIKSYNHYIDSARKAGLSQSEMFNDLIIFKFDENFFSKELTAQLVDWMIDHSGSCKTFYEYVLNGDIEGLKQRWMLE